jgi:hypothetical protein
MTVWTIDFDYLNDGGDSIPSRKGRLYEDFEHVSCTGSELRHLWRVKDADGMVYYEGRSSAKWATEPLEWARADAGATDIEYMDNGVWKGL